MALSASPLTVYEHHVESCRHHFMEWLQTLPQPLGHIATAHYRERVERSGGKPLLGEYAPWLIADLYSINDAHAVARVADAWFHVYAYTLFLDDLLDRTDVRDGAQLIIVSGVILEKGLSSLHRFLSERRADTKWIGEYFAQTATGAIDEISNHRRAIRAFTEDELLALGRKVSMLDLCAASLLSATHEVDARGEVLKPLKSLTAGMQLLDDLGDWKEDWRAGNFTYLLTLTMNTLAEFSDRRISAPEDLTEADVLTAMIVTGAVEQSVRRSVELLRDTREGLSSRIRESASRYLGRVLKDCENLVRAAEVARKVCMEETPSHRELSLASLANNIRVRPHVDLVARRIAIVAQRS